MTQKQLLYLAVLLLFLCGITGCSENSLATGTEEVNYDFRNCTWGMSQEEVMEHESEPSIYQLNETYLRCDDVKVSGLSCDIIYQFENDKLVYGMISFQESHSNKNFFISDFNTIEEALTTKYGNPVEEKVRWLNDLYQDDTDNWGKAISMGHLVMGTTWETDTTEIISVLGGDNYQISMAISYIPKGYESEIDTSGL